MSRRCDLTGTGSQYGNKVSHSNRKSRTRFEPNLQEVTLHSEALNKYVGLRVTVAALRSVEHNGGLDAFLLKRSEKNLGCAGQKLRREVKKALKKAA